MNTAPAINLPTLPEPEAITLWPDPPPSTEQWTLRNGQRVVRNVNVPVLLPVLPAPGRANGRAVLVLPGGGFRFLSMDNEGHAVAQALAAAGYTAFVLKCRVLPTAADAATFVADFDAFIMAAVSRPPEQRGGSGAAYPPAADDTRQALRLLRQRSGQWQIDPDRIGFIGFSAGALIGRALVESHEPQGRSQGEYRSPQGRRLPDEPDALPHTLALLYGSMLALPAPAPAGLPPLFAALAADDPLFGRQGFGLIESWQQAGQRAELHLYERGEHGFGMAPLGTTSDHWCDAYLAWLARQ